MGIFGLHCPVTANEQQCRGIYRAAVDLTTSQSAGLAAQVDYDLWRLEVSDLPDVGGPEYGSPLEDERRFLPAHGDESAETSARISLRYRALDTSRGELPGRRT